jgi:hypothetical protein
MRSIWFTKFLKISEMGYQQVWKDANRDAFEKLSQAPNLHSVVGKVYPTPEDVERMIDAPIESVTPFIFMSSENEKYVEPNDFKLPLPFESVWVEAFDGPLAVKQDRFIDFDMFVSEEDGREFKLPGRAQFVSRCDVLGALLKEFEDGSYYCVLLERWINVDYSAPFDSPKLRNMFDTTYKGKTRGYTTFECFLADTFCKKWDRENLLKLTSDIGPLESEKTNQEAPTIERQIYLAVDKLFSSIHNRQYALGSMKINEKLRVGRGDTRRVIRIRDLMVVSPKTMQSSVDEKLDTASPIDWSHQWEVMGHWRRVKGIGKDRNGSYTQVGYTWVEPHIKGPENKPFVKKKRLVPEPKNDVPANVLFMR